MTNRPILDLVHEITTHLLTHIPNNRVAELEAWWMLEKLTNQEKALLIAHQELSLSPQQQETLNQWLHERITQKKPLQYILGSVPFCNLTIMVQPPFLIPRPETEEMVAWLIETIKKAHAKNVTILDLCTGTGCIGLALAAALPDAHIVGIDINDGAIKLAQQNKALNKLSNITFTQSDLYKALDADEKFDLIISNPPYLSETCYAHVSEEIRLWEDKNALVGNHEGMIFYEKIISQAPLYLKNNTLLDKNVPQLVLEIGIDQDSIEELFSKTPFREVKIYNDMQGMKRWVTARI